MLPSTRMTRVTSCLNGAVLPPHWIALPRKGCPSVPLCLLTSTLMRMACQSRVIRRAMRTVRGYNPGAQICVCLCFVFLNSVITFFFGPSLVEERVGLPQVQGRLYLNRVFHVSASKMFDLLFTESSFVHRFQNIRKITSK